MTAQGGTDLDDTWEGAALVNDGSIVLAGHTFGNWTGTRHVLDGDRDFAAMAVDEDGEHLWSYQVKAMVLVLRCVVCVLRPHHVG